MKQVTSTAWQEALIDASSLVAARFPNPRAARAFSDYLTTQAIANRLMDTAEGSLVELLDRAQQQRFEHELARFLQNPQDERYLAASWASGQANDPADTRALSAVYGREAVPLAKRRAGPFTRLIIGVCLVVFAELNLGDPLGWWPTLQFFPGWDALLGSGDAWRWFTPSLSHYQLLHVGFNLLWWWDLAGNTERQKGSMRLLILFLLLNVVSNLSQFVVSGPNFLGLSGVVYGVLGYLWAYARVCPDYPEPLNPLVFRSMVIWLVICLTGVVDLFMPGGIANAAHLGGLLAGMAAGYLWAFLDKKTG